MSKTGGQKEKILAVLQILNEETDESHPLTSIQIAERVNEKGIRAEKKGIRSDILALQRHGVKIAFVRGARTGYYLSERLFTLPELKMLIDTVQASRFLTEKRADELIKKLTKECSVHDAKGLRRQVHVSGRITTMNESIYDAVDTLHHAIEGQWQVSFYYFDYTYEKERAYRHSNKLYQVSPYALRWDQGYYYLIAFDAESEKMKHYRLDRMEQVRVVSCHREGQSIYAGMDMSVYMEQVFSMFGGTCIPVTLRFKNAFAGIAIDRFGKMLTFFPEGEGHFVLHAPVVVSAPFFGWVASLGDGVKILNPPEVVEGMQAFIKTLSEIYGSSHK